MSLEGNVLSSVRPTPLDYILFLDFKNRSDPRKGTLVMEFRRGNGHVIAG